MGGETVMISSQEGLPFSSPKAARSACHPTDNWVDARPFSMGGLDFLEETEIVTKPESRKC